MTAGKHIFLDLLRSEGVEFVFGNPGTTELPLMDAFVVETGIRYILGLNEVVVLGMADGYAQATGKLAVANLHAAPGLGNALGMLYNAKKAGAPILVTAGQQDTTFALTEPLLWDDLVSMARPLVKWSHEVSRLADLPRAVRRAAKVALTQPTGPVFLSIPGDILTDAAEGLDLLAPTRIGARIIADADSIEAAADLIAASSSPVIFAGDAVARSDAHAELAALAEAIGAPVHLEGMANTAAFPSNHPLFAGSVSRMAPALRAVMDRHDLLVSIGADLLTQSQASGVEALAPGTKVVHLDNDAWEIGKNHPAAAALLGDPKATLPLLTEAVLRRVGPAAARRVGAEAAIAARQAKLIAQAEAEADLLPLRPLPVLHRLGQLIPDDAIVIEELLSSGMNTVRQLISATRPDSWFGMRGGGIGVALPQAVGIKLGLPDRPVVVLSGDGSAMYSLQALWTAARYRLHMVVVIFNNRSYRILKQRTRAIGGHSAAADDYIAMDLDDPALDFIKLSEGLGVEAVRVAGLDDLAREFQRGLAGTTPLVIEVEIDRTV
ncbi:thiamine pyrophosphate-binding protein [Glacieibacterium sp.]|uniref:thiamine pyrophosphate-binding protein n=1 Tax=Glacieibacterium sp. TaxID=2860237 RepID=UPI003B0006B5